MAHFAKLDENNIVVDVNVVNNDVLTPNNEEESGVAFLTEWSGGHSNWKQTSYNTNKGVHQLGGSPFRKNYAGIGYIYDEERDAFIPPSPYPSWVLNEDTCQWEAPKEKPLETKTIGWYWNEETVAWEQFDKSVVN